MLGAGELHALVEEARPLVIGGRIQRIRSAAGRLSMQIYAGGVRSELLWVLHPPYPRVQIAGQPFEAGEDAPPLFAQIRARLANARVRDLRALPGERIVILEADAGADGRPARYELVAELFGSRCDLHLTDGDGRVLASLHAPPPGAVDGIYAPPVRKTRSARDPAPLFPMLPADASKPFGPAFEAWAARAEQEDRLASEKSELIKAIGKRLRKEEQLLKALDADLAAAGGAPELRRRGELILQNLKTIPKGAPSVVLTDYACDPPKEILVPLDPARTAAEIAGESFDRAKKLTRSLTKLGARHADATARIAELQSALEAAGRAGSSDGIAELRRLAQARRWMAAGPAPASRAGLAPKPRQEATRKPYRTFRSGAGIEILVGRTAADNDELTLKIARGNDLWLHVANYAGSHVVVRTADEVPGETLLDAALLALHYSQARKAGGGEVSYTRAKHVRKFRGAKPGQVQLAERKTLRVRSDPARLQRILATGGEGGQA